MAEMSCDFTVALVAAFQDECHLYLLQEAVMGGEFFTYMQVRPAFSKHVVQHDERNMHLPDAPASVCIRRGGFIQASCACGLQWVITAPCIRQHAGSLRSKSYATSPRTDAVL